MLSWLAPRGFAYKHRGGSLHSSLWLRTVNDSPTTPRFNCDTITYCDRTHASMAPLSNCKHSIQSLAQMKRPGGMREAIKLILIN